MRAGRHVPQARRVGALVRVGNVPGRPRAQAELLGLDHREPAGLDPSGVAVVGGEQVEHQGVVGRLVDLDGLPLGADEREPRSP